MRHLLPRFFPRNYSFCFRRPGLRHFIFPNSLVLSNETFYALTSECFDSWRSRRRSGKEKGKRRNGGNSRLLQSPQPVCPEGSYWMARRLLMLLWTGASVGIWGGGGG